jgi:hypothetical protein
MKYSHKYHVLFPLNILMERRKRIKSLIHFWLYALGIIDLMKRVDDKIERESDQLKPN